VMSYILRKLIMNFSSDDVRKTWGPLFDIYSYYYQVTSIFWVLPMTIFFGMLGVKPSREEETREH
jgi:hypothetical protein